MLEPLFDLKTYVENINITHHLGIFADAILNENEDLVYNLISNSDIVEHVMRLPAMEHFLLAVSIGNIFIVEQFLAYEGIQARLAIFNNLALQIAMLKGHTIIAKRLLMYDQVKDNASVNENYVLNLAILIGDVRLVYLLLTIPSVIAKLRENPTPLKVAVYAHRLRIVQKLLRYSFVSDSANADNNSLLEWTIKNGVISIIRTLMKQISVSESLDFPLLFHWLKSARTEVIIFVLKYPTVKDALISNQHDFLIWAIQKNNMEVINALMSIPNTLVNISRDNNLVYSYANTFHNEPLMAQLDSMPCVIDKQLKTNMVDRFIARDPIFIDLNTFVFHEFNHEDMFDALIYVILHGEIHCLQRFLRLPKVQELIEVLTGQQRDKILFIVGFKNDPQITETMSTWLADTESIFDAISPEAPQYTPYQQLKAQENQNDQITTSNVYTNNDNPSDIFDRRKDARVC